MKKVLLISIMILVSLGSNAQSTISLGILSDYNLNDSIGSRLNKEITEEIKKVMGIDYTVVADPSLIKSCNWDSETAKQKYAEISKTADVIILVGPHSAKGSLQNLPFTKKTIALGVFNAQLQSIPNTDEGRSGTPNFSYITTKATINAELMNFKSDLDFNHLGILLDNKTKETINQNLLDKYVSNLKDSLGSNVTVHYLDADNVSEEISNLPSTVDAVFVGVPYEWNEKKAKSAFDKLSEMKIPSLVMNDNYLKSGGLLAYSKNTSLEYILRKLSLMVSNTFGGEPMEKMNVYINEKEETSINLNTAKKINYSASFQTIFTANIIKSDKGNANPTFSIQYLIKKALEENLNISISKKDVELSANDVALAKSQFLPTIDANANAIQLDKNRPNPLLLRAERTITVGGQAQQLIYSESAIANIRIQKHLLKAQEYATEQEILDQLLTIFNSYFSLLQAKTNLSIQNENYEATKKNLELAQTRNSIGSTNKSDLYRWQSELANAKQNVIEANTQVIALKYQLNTFLNNTLPDEFDIEDLLLNNSILRWFEDSGLEKAINTPASLHKLTNFLSEESIKNYPAKKQLLSNIDAVERQQLMNKRLYYTPVVALQGQIDQNIYRGGLASEPLPGSSFYNNTWSVGVSVKYPIFQGNRRKLNLNQNNIVLNQLDQQSTNLSQNLQLQVKVNTLNIISSKINIENSKIARDNAEENFKLVQQNYQLGTINITQLIDAQKNLFSLRQAYSIAVYEYLLNFIKLENGIGFYSILATEEEKKEFQNRYLQYISNN